jgi:hypothetical protein
MLRLVTARQLLLATTVAALILSGCGGSSTAYPTVVVPPPKDLPPITTANGAVVWLPVPPRVYSTRPAASCEWVAYQPTRNKPPGGASLSPPAPGLKAVALSRRTVRIEYSFRTLPADCRPSFVTVGIVASRSAVATPWVEHFRIHGLSGTGTLTSSPYYPPPDVATATADMSNGLSSRPVKVLIRR